MDLKGVCALLGIEERLFEAAETKEPFGADAYGCLQQAKSGVVYEADPRM